MYIYVFINHYRPVSFLSDVSKVFDRWVFRQVSDYVDYYLSKYHCRFRKCYSTQNCFLYMLDKWKHALKNGKVFAVLITDLSKVFDCLSHELYTYGFSNKKQRTKINSSYISLEEIFFGVSQGSILRPLLFSIFLCDTLFLLSETEFAIYADNKTPYVISDNINDIIKILGNDSIGLFK